MRPYRGRRHHYDDPAAQETMKAAIYVRVSTATKTAGVFDQDPAMQVEPLKKYVEGRGWELVRIYADRASGAQENRPALDTLMRDAYKRLFDVVVVWKFDRFARSLKQLVSALDEFVSLNIAFVSHQEALDGSTPAGRLMFQMIGAMAEFERSLIRERVIAGVEHAKIHGTRSGNPIGRPRAIFPRGKVAELVAGGLSLRGAAKKLGIGYGTARKDLSENPTKNPIIEGWTEKGTYFPCDPLF
jgi:DNA invertase Pin-like site-specific DNA recombinase